MVKVNGLAGMSYAELSDLRDRVDAAMIEAKASEKQALQAKLEELAAQAGFTLAELARKKRNASKGALKGTKVAAKYRNPKDASQTWAGRGRQPLWLVAALKKGQKIENFAV